MNQNDKERCWLLYMNDYLLQRQVITRDAWTQMRAEILKQK